MYHPILIGLTNVRCIEDRRNPRTVAVWKCLVHFYNIVAVAEVRAFQHIIRAYAYVAVIVHRNIHQIIADQGVRSFYDVDHLRDLLLAARVVHRILHRAADLNAVDDQVLRGRAGIKRRHHCMRSQTKGRRIKNVRRNTVDHQ